MELSASSIRKTKPASRSADSGRSQILGTPTGGLNPYRQLIQCQRSDSLNPSSTPIASSSKENIHHLSRIPTTTDHGLRWQRLPDNNSSLPPSCVCSTLVIVSSSPIGCTCS
ncbi:unnamed protein product [Pleuronectes platessa]|uniref:Uncharacterized protein n=1 Tax=Pleuronectes platessa TaxID=8262 RepID=A0A9N7U9K1_PLEPL|nr:unnamed protein product [Pleuronectes platessa]